MNDRIKGLLALLALIFVIVVIYFVFYGGCKSTTTLIGYIGGEKEGFFEDEKLKDLLLKEYNIELDVTNMGSVDIVSENLEADFLFPSNQIYTDVYKDNKDNSYIKNDIIFNSPIVLYSWNEVTEALIKEKIVEKKYNSYYIVDMPKLINDINENKKWSDYNLDLYGNIEVITTDPVKSNSGNLFFSLMANILNNGEVVDDNTVNEILPSLKNFYNNLGYLEDRSDKLFEGFLSKGKGEFPLISGYESQLIEYAINNEEEWEQVKNEIKILYPKPTVWSSHDLIITNDKASNLNEILLSDEVQKIAWEYHGLRPSGTGIINKNNFETVCIPEKIDNVVSLPKESVVTKILNSIQ
jgi:hypothetical protein